MSPIRRRLVVGVTWIVASALVWYLAHSVNREMVWERLQRANPAWIVLALLANFLIMICWTQQWRALLPGTRPVEWPRMLSIVGITAVAGNTIPASGQITTVVLLAREPGVTYAAALSVLALDQLLEAICKTAIVLFAATLLPLPEDMKHAVFALGIAAAVSLVVLVVFANQKRYLVRFALELESLRNVRRLVVAVVFCLGAKFCEFAAIVAVQHAFGERISLSITVLVEAAILLGTIFPLSPANIGTYEASVSIVYR